MNVSSQQHFQELVTAVLHHDATAGQWHELSEILCGDKAAVDEYIRQIDTHLDLTLLLHPANPAPHGVTVSWPKFWLRLLLPAVASLAIFFGGRAVLQKRNILSPKKANLSVVATTKDARPAVAAKVQPKSLSKEQELSCEKRMPETRLETEIVQAPQKKVLEKRAAPLQAETADLEKKGDTMNRKMMTATASAASALALAVAPMSLSAGTENSSAEIVVTAKPEASVYWHTLPARSFSMPVFWPDKAVSATLCVSGMAVKASNTSLVKTASSEEVTLTFAAPDLARLSTDVIDLTLTFSDGTVRTARLGNVGGVSGNAMRLIPAGSASKDWGKVEGSAVLPVQEGDTAITLDGVTKTLDGAAGWYGWSPIGKGTHTIALRGTSMEVKKIAHGTVIMLQ